MRMAVQAIPDGYHAVTPYLIVDDADGALEFYKQAFGAQEELRLVWPDGSKIGHAEITIGDSRVMLADEHPEFDALGPKTRGGTPVTLCFYCDNVDERFAQAVAAGATVVRPLQNQFYGDRSGNRARPLRPHLDDHDPHRRRPRRRAREPHGRGHAVRLPGKGIAGAVRPGNNIRPVP